MAEEWRKILGYDEYEVSSLGNVRRNYQILKPVLSNNKYYCVQLSNDSVRKSKTIHRLVASCFIPNPDNKPCVDHISGNKLDNGQSNLRWVTKSENQLNPNTPQKFGASGLRHIYQKGPNSWSVSIQRNGTVIYSKRFKTIQEAITARDNFINSM